MFPKLLLYWGEMWRNESDFEHFGPHSEMKGQPLFLTVLRIEHYQSAYVILVTGWTLALIMFLTELIIKYTKLLGKLCTMYIDIVSF